MSAVVQPKVTPVATDLNPVTPSDGGSKAGLCSVVLAANQPQTELDDFYRAISIREPGSVQIVVTNGLQGAPTDHAVCKPDDDFAGFAQARVVGTRPAYISMASFAHGAVNRFSGRTKANAVSLAAFWFDIEGSKEKFNRPGGAKAGYPNCESALRAVKSFISETQLRPNYVVYTGSGGIHVYWVLSAAVSPADHTPRATRLLQLATANDLLIDAQCTTDTARIMRAPGSVHQKTGHPVHVRKLQAEPYTLAEFDKLLGLENRVSGMGVTTAARQTSGINADVLSPATPYSVRLAAAKCQSLAMAMSRNGKDTPYLPWVLAAKTADLSVEGRVFAHEVSSGHPDYDPSETEKKLDSLTGGPASCEAWASAWGSAGPCASCSYRGQVKNPAIQLGAMVNTTIPGATATVPGNNLPQWVAELNQRYALCRVGSKVVVVDRRSPSMSVSGALESLGFLDLSAFRTMLSGRYVPFEKPGEKSRPLADSWLRHPDRRQYEGLVFSPGASIPERLLNLWQGFAVEPRSGDVSLWMDVLKALVPGDDERLYVLRWLAWKIQNPGGVPDTILIFRGAKGTGKNSLFDPVLTLFGRNALLADDAELIAGRFTWHLMSICFAVLDEAVFVGDPRQADRIKSRVTAKQMTYEQKGMDPVQGINRCAYVMLTNHEHVWQATCDERRAVVIDVGEGLKVQALDGNADPNVAMWWERYHAWATGDGPSHLLHMLLGLDLTGFNPRVTPKNEALRQQVEITALRDPAAAWWHQCLTEGSICWRDGGVERRVDLSEESETQVNRAHLRSSYEGSGPARGRGSGDWPSVSRKLNRWAGLSGLRKTRVRTGAGRTWTEGLPSLQQLRKGFTDSTGVRFDP